MTTDPVITCPNCSTSIPLTESLAQPLIQQTRRHYEQLISDKDRDIAGREVQLRTQQTALAQERADIERQVAERTESERGRIAAEESARAKRMVAAEIEGKGRELAELQQVLREREGKLAEAQKTQADLMRKQRELEDARRELDLTIEKRVQESLTQVREQARQEAEDGLRLRVAEKEEQIASMQRQIDDLKRKAEQGSQQLQGEVQELALESTLRTRFPMDIIEPVPKGEFGGDVLHRVLGPLGQACGTILWESKRTRNWTDGWLTKLRDDQRRAKAEIALIVSNALPKGVQSFDHIDGVWVTESRCAVPVAIALRQSLIEVAAARKSGEGQQTKKELVYQYLTGPRFRQRIEAIVEKFSEMQADLDKERKAMLRQWAKREGQLRGVLEATAGMYGDLQGIAGSAFEEIEGMALPLIADETPDTEEQGGPALAA